jgi:phosphopantothenoylcysteine decarboxylase/phosphopantothenate--cysteine ligase
VLAELGKARKGTSPLLVGFAAETEDVIENARKKLASKQVDLIVANDVSEPNAGFAVDTNRVTLFGRDGSREALPLLSKREVADRILDRVAAALDGRDAGVQTASKQVSASSEGAR